jgi:hypothetical protein
LQHISQISATVSTQFSLAIKAIQADNGTEFVNNTLQTLFASRGIHLRLSCPYTSPHNGKAERILRTLNNISRTMLIHAHMPAPYWAEALATATYLLNRRPSSAVRNAVPYALLYNKPPEYSHLRAFGCLCYPKLTTTAPHKLAPVPQLVSFLATPLPIRDIAISIYRHGASSSHTTLFFTRLVFPSGLTPPGPRTATWIFCLQVLLWLLRHIPTLSNHALLRWLLRSCRTTPRSSFAGL